MKEVYNYVLVQRPFPRPSDYPLLDSKYHQVRTIRFQLRAVGRSRLFGYLDP